MTALMALLVFAVVGSAVLAIFAAISPKQAGEGRDPRGGRGPDRRRPPRPAVWRWLVVTRLPRLFAGCFTDKQLADDSHRLEPRSNSLGDGSVPCRWWHPDMGPFCARCGSGRIDLHDGEWSREQDGSMLGSGPFRGIPWTDAQRAMLGLPVVEEWWHQAAGIGGPS